MIGFVVGQKLFVHYREPYLRRGKELIERTVAKVGRKWVTFDCGERFDGNTMRIDGSNFGSTGDVFFSEDHYAATVKRDEAWRNLKKLTLPYDCPEHLSLFDVNMMIGKLAGDPK